MLTPIAKLREIYNDIPQNCTDEDFCIKLHEYMRDLGDSGYYHVLFPNGDKMEVYYEHAQYTHKAP